jgi:iron complex outermembrane receptor protein
VAVDLLDNYRTEQHQVGASIAGEWFDLPGGTFGWAAGYGFLREDYTYSPDSAKQLDQVTGNTGLGTDGSLTSNAVFAEFYAPLFDNDSQSLVFTGGVRYDDYDEFDAEVTWKAGLEFNALKSLKFRGTYSTVFRAPTIIDLFSGLVDSFPTYADPCAPAAGQALPPGCAQQIVQVDAQLRRESAAILSSSRRRAIPTRWAWSGRRPSGSATSRRRWISGTSRSRKGSARWACSSSWMTAMSGRSQRPATWSNATPATIQSRGSSTFR